VQNDKEILNDISFSVKENQKACLAGPSGSGKSTLLKLAMGIYLPTSGSIRIAGRELSRETLREIRDKIAYIDQDAVMGAETVREAMLLPYTFKANKDKDPDEAELKEALKQVGLDSGILEKETDVISGGERQRVAIARAVLMRKEIFAADEVTSSLDPENRRQVTRFLLKLEATLLAVSHDEEFQQDYDLVIRLEKGGIDEIEAH
jgi:putative ABC transport system ATP-binding protein